MASIKVMSARAPSHYHHLIIVLVRNVRVETKVRVARSRFAFLLDVKWFIVQCKKKETECFVACHEKNCIRTTWRVLKQPTKCVLNWTLQRMFMIYSYIRITYKVISNEMCFLFFACLAAVRYAPESEALVKVSGNRVEVWQLTQIARAISLSLSLSLSLILSDKNRN